MAELSDNSYVMPKVVDEGVVEYRFKLHDGASVEAKYGTAFFDGAEHDHTLKLEGRIKGSSRELITSAFFAGFDPTVDTEVEIEVVARVKSKFKPGYFRRNLRHPNNRETARWYDSPPWKRSDTFYNQSSDWQRVAVAGVVGK